MSNYIFQVFLIKSELAYLKSLRPKLKYLSIEPIGKYMLQYSDGDGSTVGERGEGGDG